MSNLKYKLEALLFSSAREMKIEELANLTKTSSEEVREKLNELKKDYEQRDSSITLIDYGDSVKLNVKSEHAPIIHQIVTETELSKTLMETLAVIAFKYPIKQSDIIKLRTNKAYDHLKKLEEMGYITKQKYSRTQLIKLTPKFFEYFDLPADKIKEKFQGFDGIAKAIKEKEEEIKKVKEEMKKKAEEAGKKEVKEGEPEIDLTDKEGKKERLAIYKETEQEFEQEEAKKIEPYKDKVGGLEVIDLPEKEEVEEQEETEEEPTEETQEEKPEEKEEITEEEEKEVVEEAKEIVEEETEEKKEEKAPEETESEVDKELEKMLHPEEESQEEVSKEKQTLKEPEQSAEEEPKEEAEKSEEEQKIKDFPTSESYDSEEPKDLLEAALEEEQKQQPKKRK